LLTTTAEEQNARLLLQSNMTQVMVPAAYEHWYPFFATFDRFNEQTTPMTTAAPVSTASTPIRVSSRNISTPASSRSRSRKRVVEQPLREPSYVDPPGEFISPAERELRIDEARFLFPKYMAKENSKRAQNTDSRRQSDRDPLLFLPGSQYKGHWEADYYCCSPSLDPKRREITVNYFKADCRNRGEPISYYAPAPLESDPDYYDQEWNQRVNPLVCGTIVPPEKGSLDMVFSHKKVKHPQWRVIMDSFVLALKKEMGDDYFDVNEIQYYPRSDRRVHQFYHEKSRKYKQMKNGVFDVEHCLRNRTIERNVADIKKIYQDHKYRWTDEIAAEWERRIIQFVNPYTKVMGRTHFSEQEDLGIEDDRHLPVEPMAEEIFRCPPGSSDEDLGKTFYWSELAGRRMVSVEEKRQDQLVIKESDERYQAEQAAIVLGIGTRSKARSPNRMRYSNSRSPSDESA
jgi:hypothetical protein